MYLNEHGNLVDKESAGNGYHGRCEYCGLALVTDLGYTSWVGTKCKDRPIEQYSDVPKQIREYATFRGLVWHTTKYIFIKPYSNERYTLDRLDKIVKKLTKQNQ